MQRGLVSKTHVLVSGHSEILQRFRVLNNSSLLSRTKRQSPTHVQHGGRYKESLRFQVRCWKALHESCRQVWIILYANLDHQSNPCSLFPYDEVSYQDLDRNSYALVFSASSQSAGFLPDEWSSIEFDAKTSIVRMMVYRPVGEIFEKRSRSVQCGSVKLRERSVEARLNP